MNAFNSSGTVGRGGRPYGLPAARWMAAFVLRSDTEPLLKSRRVVLDAGFEFAFPQWAAAAEDRARGRHVKAVRGRPGRTP